MMLAALVLISLATASGAAAKLTGIYAKFAQCPFNDPEAFKCIHSATESGEVVLGDKRVPILNPVVLQGAFAEPDKKYFSKFIPATNGETLTRVAQPIPGGLAGVVSPQNASPLVKAAVALFFENGLTGVFATLELARPADSIVVNEINLAQGGGGPVLTLPLRMHLENPFLGPFCYVGSAQAPVVWRLESGTTSPPPPNKPISGGGGKGEFYEEGRIFGLEGTKLVDNSWAAPAVSGCGGFLSFLVDPMINARLGDISAGHNTAILVNTLDIASVVGLEENEKENP